MRAKVRMTFFDKYTNDKYETGSVIELTKERFEEVQLAGNFLKPVNEDEKEPAEESEKEPAEEAEKEPAEEAEKKSVEEIKKKPVKKRKPKKEA